MKKILHVSKYYYPFRGGTEQIALDCVNSSKDIYEQKVICFNHKKGSKKDAIYGVEVIRCGCFAKVSSQALSLCYGKFFKEIIKCFVPDIIIFHYPNPFVGRYLLKYIPKQTKLVVYWHLDIVKQKILKNFFARQNRELIKRADMLIATSPKYVEGSTYLKETIYKCKIIPNCINEKRLLLSEEIKTAARKIRSDNKGKIICLAVGRHTKYKGFKYLIQASRKLDNRFEIFIAGKGEETKHLKKEAKGDKKIHFLGSINDDILKAYFLAMDIFCFPSVTKNEAFGLALAEGMYFEKPVVTFNIPGSGVNYVSINGNTGIEVPNRNVDAYAKALDKLAKNPDLRLIYGRNGKERVINNFLYIQFKNNIIEAINNIY